jgi:hypothetical protein
MKAFIFSEKQVGHILPDDSVELRLRTNGRGAAFSSVDRNFQTRNEQIKEEENDTHENLAIHPHDLFNPHRHFCGTVFIWWSTNRHAGG